MPVTVTRKNIFFTPDSKRVVARFFNNGDVRTTNLVHRIMALSDAEVKHELKITLQEFVGRHRNISDIFLKHADNYKNLLNSIGINYSKLSLERRLLIGSYSTMEYSIESAALFNPSMIEDFDQSFLAAGEKRVIISFRATGEGHLSSIVFRRGILDADNNLRMNKVRNHIDTANIVKKKSYDKGRFVQKMNEMKISKKYSSIIMEHLPDPFEYHQLTGAVQ